MVDTPMDPDHKNGEIRSRPQKWAGLGGGQCWVFLRFDTPQGAQRNLFCYKRSSRNLKRMNITMECTSRNILVQESQPLAWGWRGSQNQKSKMMVSKTCIFCRKSTITRRFVICRQNFISYLDSPGKITLISVIKSIGQV